MAMSKDVREKSRPIGSATLTRMAGILNSHNSNNGFSETQPPFIVDGFEVRRGVYFSQFLADEARSMLNNFQKTEEGRAIVDPQNRQWANQLLQVLQEISPCIDNRGWVIPGISRVARLAVDQYKYESDVNIINASRVGIWLGFEATRWATNRTPEQMLSGETLESLLPVPE